MQSSPVGVVGTQGQQNPTGHDAFQDVKMDDFIKLLVAQLQHQDPMEPMSNSEILQQVSQIRAIESNQRLTETLESVSLGQSVATASSLLDQVVTGLTHEDKKVTGRVERVSIENGIPLLHVGQDTIKLKNLGEILPPEGNTQQNL